MSFLPTVPRQPVRLYIYFIAYERVIHPFVFPNFAHHGRSECPLGTRSLLTCGYAGGLVLYSLYA